MEEKRRLAERDRADEAARQKAAIADKKEAEQKRIAAAERAKKKKIEREMGGAIPEDPANTDTADKKEPSSTELSQPLKPDVPVKKVSYPTATSVVGKEGMVLSPYNNRVIDVRGLPSGSLVRDPTYDASEKKYFRVP